MKNSFKLLTLLLCVSLFGSANERETISYFDKEDSMLDLSEYISQAYGFIPLPIIITEPSIGYGGGLALVYLHDKIASRRSKTGRVLPSSISAVLYATTENGTRATGGAHIGYWQEDTIRTTTYIGSPDIFINIYNKNSAIEMNLQGFFFYQNARFRIAESNFFVGASYLYLGVDSKFELGSTIEDLSSQSSVSALGAIATYDSRDNSLSPNRGILVNAKAQMFDEAIGSDFSFQSYKAEILSYNPITPKINLDLNLIAQKITGYEERIAPYLVPYISMRGIPVMRYQGETTLSIESQLSYQFGKRFRGVAFAGAAKAFGDQILSETLSFSDAKSIYSGGLGFRYLIAKKYGLRIGIDLAKSREDKAIYIQFGTAWNGF
ncbi:Outer membrane protein/protective antigen OMA87 [hydrothermal vent metagenome]|uniref:Outer membrane protein/protective antigen OMA87 n=1 Tax=hydrothermal vent metagenome TaxID=652676 RepID=A0A1W1C7Q6_9ZZZZ